jgi:hypothetical protein
VPQRHDGAGVDDPADRVGGSREFRRDGDHPDGALPGIEQRCHIERLRRP